MAIPGYINTYSISYTETEYYKELVPLVGLLGDSITDVIQFIKQVIEDIKNNTRIIDSNAEGILDLSRVNTQTVLTLRSMDAQIAMRGDASDSWPLGFWEYYGGKICGFFGELADEAALTWSKTVANQLQSPTIYVTNLNNAVASLLKYEPPSNPYRGHNFISIPLVATFETKWGETPPSEPVIVYQLVSTDGMDGVFLCTIETAENSIPNYATSVKYYMFKDNAYYLISEVKI